MKTKTMRQLTVTIETFNKMLSDLIQSGVTFDAEENNKTGYIIITFLGGY